MSSGEILDPSKPDRGVFGILIGLGIGLLAALACVFLFILLMGFREDSWYIKFLVPIPYLLPPAIVCRFGIVARRDGRPKYAAGLFIAAAAVTLLEGTCARYLWHL
jgi:ABC-type Na+ efflux pump permease subunit